MGPMTKPKPADQPYASPRGKINPVVDQSKWRRQLRADQVKFDDEAKARYLQSLVSHGKRSLAAEAAGVSQQTVKNHMKIDPEFCELFDAALQERADRITQRIEEEALEGFDEPIFSQKTGELLGYRKVLETPIRLAILKRYDPEYKDRSETTVNGTIGVLVAPAQMAPADWIAQQQELNATRTEPDRDNLDAPPAAQQVIEHTP